MKEFDVYAYGVIASSELHLLSMAFPSPDGYAEIAETHIMTGGEALKGMVCASFPGVLNSPTHAEAMQFIQEHC